MKCLREEQKDWAIVKDQVEQLNTIQKRLTIYNNI